MLTFHRRRITSIRKPGVSLLMTNKAKAFFQLVFISLRISACWHVQYSLHHIVPLNIPHKSVGLNREHLVSRKPFFLLLLTEYIVYYIHGISLHSRLRWRKKKSMHIIPTEFSRLFFVGENFCRLFSVQFSSALESNTFLLIQSPEDCNL